MTKCTKCNTQNKSDSLFCTKCGKKLKASMTGATKPSLAPWLIPWIVLGGLLVVVGGIVLPTKITYYDISVPYITTEQYTVDVPYEDIEEYVAQVPYQVEEQYSESVPVEVQEDYLDQECYDEDVKYLSEWEECGGGLFGGEATLKVTNIGDEGGVFTFRVGYTSNEGNFVYDTMSESISPTRSATFTYSPTPISFPTCDAQEQSIPEMEVCETVTKERTVTEFKDQIQVRTVTKYRDETKYRKVTKIRTETREREVQKYRTERRYKEVNSFFEFDALIKFRDPPETEVLIKG